MRYAHQEAQRHFAEIGRALGYGYRKTWSRGAPTDGVWLSRPPNLNGEELPIAAIEVAASESPKSLRGSVATLCHVSPALGIVLLHDEEIVRRLVRHGRSREYAYAAVWNLTSLLRDELASQRQRIEIWNPRELKRRWELLVPRH